MIDNEKLRSYIVEVIKKMMLGSTIEQGIISEELGYAKTWLWRILKKRADITLISFINFCYLNNYNFVNAIEQLNKLIIEEGKLKTSSCTVSYCKHSEKIDFFDYVIEKDETGEVKFITFFCYMPILQARYNGHSLSDLVLNHVSRHPLFIDFKVLNPETYQTDLEIKSKCKVYPSKSLNETPAKIYAYDFVIV